MKKTYAFTLEKEVIEELERQTDNKSEFINNLLIANLHLNPEKRLTELKKEVENLEKSKKVREFKTNGRFTNEEIEFLSKTNKDNEFKRWDWFKHNLKWCNLAEFRAMVDEIKAIEMEGGKENVVL